MKTKNPIALLIGWIALAMAPNHAVSGASDVGAPSAAVAQGGVIEGRVFNPSSGEYLRNAEVRVEGTDIIAISARDGRYRIMNVPAGNVTVSVSYTGYRPASATLTLADGGVVTRDFDLQSTLQRAGKEVVELEKFTVSSSREGTAKAIMEQRSAMTVKNVVATDTFGTPSSRGISATCCNMCRACR